MLVIIMHPTKVLKTEACQLVLPFGARFCLNLWMHGIILRRGLHIWILTSGLSCNTIQPSCRMLTHIWVGGYIICTIRLSRTIVTLHSEKESGCSCFIRITTTHQTDPGVFILNHMVAPELTPCYITLPTMETGTETRPWKRD